jgi:hypothetical protein
MAATTQLGALKYAPNDASSSNQVMLCCKILPNGASAPTFQLTSTGARPTGFKSVTRSGTGALTVTLEEPWWGVLGIDTCLQLSAPAGTDVGVNTFVGGSGPTIGGVNYLQRGITGFTLTTYTVSTSAPVDIAANAQNVIHCSLTLLNGPPK